MTTAHHPSLLLVDDDATLRERLAQRAAVQHAARPETPEEEDVSGWRAGFVLGDRQLWL